MSLHPPSAASQLVASGRHAFSDAELDAIEALGDKLSLLTATLGGYGATDATKRITRVAPVDYGPETKWIYDRLNRVVGILNQQFRFNLVFFRESLQFMVYRDVEGGHFGWHSDQGPTVRRQLSLTLQLTDPARYQGGALEFMHDAKTMTAPKERGTLVAFPSHVVHRVTPVTQGTRKSIVAWVPPA
jgi:PKHD-type hydroxylase